MCIQYLQQECIDSAKNGIPPKAIPGYWLNYNDEKVSIKIDKETGEILDSDDELERKRFYQRVLTEKKPYYFRYIYKDVNKEYLNYIKSMEINSLRNFRKSIEELKASENKTDMEKDFLKYYDKHMPISNNPCVVNKIASKVENVFDGDFRYSRKDNGFNYELYKSGEEYSATTKEIKELISLYEEYKKVIKNKNKIDINDKEEKINNDVGVFIEMRMTAAEIIPNKMILADVLIDLSYKKNKISKSFTWNLVGDVIIENLLKKNNYMISYPKKDINGNIRYNGESFIMKDLCVKGDKI